MKYLPCVASHNRWIVTGVMALAGLAVLSAPSFAVDEYLWDDNSGNTGWGVQTTQPDRSFAWLNHFVIEPGAQTLTAIRVAFGGPLSSSPIPDNTPVSLYIWDDTDGDSTPYDAVNSGEPVLTTTTGVVTNSGTNLFSTYSITPLTLPVGKSFFAGAIINDGTGPHTVGRLDEHGMFPGPVPFNQSWVATSAGDFAAGTGSPPVDPSDLSAAQLAPQLVAAAFPLPSPGVTGATGDGWWMIRVNAIPEPNSLALFLIGLTAARRRFRRV